MKHYTKEELDLYRNHRMSLLGRIQCKTHLEYCARCRELLSDLDADNAFLAELRESIRNYPAPLEPARSSTISNRR